MRDGGAAMGVEEGPGLASSAASSAGGVGRVRPVRLTRRNQAESYGFSLRGGREHGTGFFISHVEAGSEAFLQGLRAGDQVIRVNNMSVEQAVHREVTAMVQSNISVILHTRSTGIIPLKEHRGDPLTWLVVEDDEDFSDLTDSYSQSLPSCSAHESELEGFPPPHIPAQHQASAHDCHARVYLSCNGKVGLGCSICKGPQEKPGIFVQSVRVGGVARSAGLRPGDQIIACNDVPFAHLDFAEAVYVLKSSPRLTLDLIRGAGLELVAGESSGYNSSASSVAGDQTPPSSTSDPRDSDHSVASRLSAVSRHLTLDRTRGWREIESEWAIAEAAERRKQLQSSQKNLKTRAQRDASHRISSINSRSLSNLSTAVREEDSEEQRTAFREGSFSPTHTASLYTHHTPYMNHIPQNHHTQSKLHKPVLRSAKSTNDVSEDTSHKIALVTSADPHVNNIVVSGGPKNERDAVLRLDQLSSTSPSRTSTLSSGTSQVTVHSSSGSGISPPMATPSTGALVERQLRELRREQQRLQDEANRLARERQKFEEEKRRGLERTQSDPLAPLIITCSGQTLLSHLEPPPSPTSSIASGRHTTRVLIKSPPPPPPPRKNTTTLTSHRGHSHPRQVSPPASPAHSSSSSSGVGSSCGSSVPPRRCKSIGSLSASSGESAVWEDTPVASQIPPITTNPSYRSSMPPPPPPKPPAPPGTLSSSINGSHAMGGAPPPPPPPPPPSTSGPPKPNFAAALKMELEQRRVKDEHIGENGDDDSKAQQFEQKIDALKKDRAKTMDVDVTQHDKLMEEVKSKHRKMFTRKEMQEGKHHEQTEPDSPNNSVTPPNMFTKTLRHVETSPRDIAPPPKNFATPPHKTVEFTSKIINNSQVAPEKEFAPMKKTLTQTQSLGGQMPTSSLVRQKVLAREAAGNTTDGNKRGIAINRFNSPVLNKVNSPASKPVERQQWSERSGDGNNSTSSSTNFKPPLRPTVSSVTVMEFKPEEKMTTKQVQPPNAFFELKKPNTWKQPNAGKPLVSISAYPSPIHRRTPGKMDFLPATSKHAEVNASSVTNGPPPPASLQKELVSTLSRANLRRDATREKPAELASSSSSSSGSTPAASFTTTTIQNNVTSPKASLSSKYRGIGHGTTVTISTKGDSGKENEAPESPPSGILKPSGPAAPNKPLQKSISFGDVTTVGEGDPDPRTLYCNAV